MTAPKAAASDARRALEEGERFTPRFGADGLVACVTRAAADGEILMVAHMNAEALRLTLETGEAHYWSRSRKSLWHKGATSGQIQKVKDIRVDCDQDVLLLTVEPAGDGGACHTGRRSCFYRRLVMTDGAPRLVFDA